MSCPFSGKSSSDKGLVSNHGGGSSTSSGASEGCPFSSAAKKKNDDAKEGADDNVEPAQVNAPPRPANDKDNDESLNRMTDSLMIAFFLALFVKIVAYLYKLKYGESLE
jgi:hypothetical protein